MAQKKRTRKQSDVCSHPPTRVYAWIYTEYDGSEYLVSGCCDCGDVLPEKLLKKAKVAR